MDKSIFPFSPRHGFDNTARAVTGTNRNTGAALHGIETETLSRGKS
jgi:hypothetical protein